MWEPGTFERLHNFPQGHSPALHMLPYLPCELSAKCGVVQILLWCMSPELHEATRSRRPPWSLKVAMIVLMLLRSPRTGRAAVLPTFRCAKHTLPLLGAEEPREPTNLGAFFMFSKSSLSVLHACFCLM